MAKKYLDKDFNEVEGLVTSAGAGDAGKIPALDGAGKLTTSVMPAGFTPLSQGAIAATDIAAGSFVNLYNDAGTLKARKADNTDNTKPADGFIQAGVLAGATAQVFMPGNLNTALSGLTIGTNYFLGTDGGITATEPSASGNIVQPVGKALSASQLVFLNTGFRKLV